MDFNGILASLVKGLTPPQLVQPEEYDGLEYRWKFFIFRPELLKEQLRYEVFLVGGLLIYIGFILWGKSTNYAKANKWFDAHLPILNQQFSKPTNGGLTQDGYSDFFNFSTGRRGVLSLHTIFTLRPRHDFLQMAFQFLWGLQDLRYKPTDELELDFKLSPDAGGSDFVFAIVSKDEMNTIRDNRWDLTFTKTSENASLPPSLSVMTEFADVTDQLLKQLVPIVSDPAILPYFRSLSVTDQPSERPLLPLTPADKEKHVIVSLHAPPPSNAADTVNFVKALFPFVDSLAKTNLRPETKTKLKRAREDVDKLIKEDNERDSKEDAAAEKLAAKKKKEDERMSKLSASEQKKVLERDRKRAIKKSQGKVQKK